MNFKEIKEENMGGYGSRRGEKRCNMRDLKD